MQKRKSYKLTSIPNKDKKHFPRSTQKKRKFLPTKYRGHEKNQHSSTIRLSKRFSFLLEQKIKRKNHPRKTRESNNYPFTPSPPFPSFLPSKKKNKIKWKKKRRKNFCPNFVVEFSSSRNVAATGGRGSRSSSSRTMSLQRTRGQGVPFARLLEASASSLNVSKRARRRDIFTRTGRLRWIGGNGPAAVLRK